MISFTAHSDDPKVRIAIETAFVEERERLLRRIARVSRGVSAGDSYERSAFLTCRDLFGGDVVNLHTWPTMYAGSVMYPEDVAYYSGQMGYDARPPRPWADVDRHTLTAERDRAATPPVSRETPPPDWVDVVAPLIAAVPQSEPDLDTGCECDDCSNVPCNGECSEEESCDDHRCTQCHGENYCCDEHSCDMCYSDHACCSACGYCSECESHAGDRDESDRDLCPNCSWCRECDHDCDNY